MPSPIKLSKVISRGNIDRCDFQQLAMMVTPQLDHFGDKTSRGCKATMPEMVALIKRSFNELLNYVCTHPQFYPGFIGVFVKSHWSGSATTILRLDEVVREFHVAKKQVAVLLHEYETNPDCGCCTRRSSTWAEQITLRTRYYEILAEFGKKRPKMTVGSTSGEAQLLGGRHLEFQETATIDDRYLITTCGTYLKTAYQGRGVMLALYRDLIERGHVLCSGGEHSVGGMKLWQALSKEDGAFVYYWNDQHEEAMHAFCTDDEQGFLTERGATHECGQTVAMEAADDAHEALMKVARPLIEKLNDERCWWMDSDTVKETLIPRDDCPQQVKDMYAAWEVAHQHSEEIRCTISDGYMMAMKA